MANLTVFPQLNLAYNDPTQEGLSFSTDVTQSYATHLAFGIRGFGSLNTNSTPVNYLTISGSSEFEHIGVFIKGFIQREIPTATNNFKAIIFEQEYCWDTNDLTQNFRYSYVNNPLNDNLTTGTNELLYDYTINNNYIEYNSSENLFNCYLALSANPFKIIKGTYLLI